MSEDKQVLNHPSYALASFSRRSGSPKLFASAIDKHYSYICLQLKRAELVRRDHGDYYNSSIQGDIVEVDFSAAQFAELLTTMNVGLGVPCTLRRLNNERIEEPPDVLTEAENVANEFEGDMKGFAKKILGTTIPRAKEILAKTNITKADRAELAGIFDKIGMELKNNIPFILDCFQEAIQKKVAVAKAEVDSLFTSVINKLGLKALEDIKQLGE
jgi:hypothetical protein